MTTAARDRRLFMVAGAVIATVSVIWSALTLAGVSVGTAHRDQHRVLRGSFRQLSIDAASADVTVVAAAGSRVTVDSRASGSLWLPKLRTTVAGDQVSVEGGCRLSTGNSCHAALVLHVPPRTALRIHANDGDVTVRGLSARVDVENGSGDIGGDQLSGPVFLRSRAGDLDVTDLGGKATLESSAGDIRAGQLTGADVSADASAGDVDLDFTAPPTRVDAVSAAGDVRVTVPDDGTSYAVDTTTSARDVAIRTDPDAARRIHAASSAGTVAIGYP